MKGSKIDKLDKEIIELLDKDVRQSYETLAKTLKVSPLTVRRRINKLIGRGVIRFGVLVDSQKTGEPLSVLFAFDVAHGSLNSVLQELTNRSEFRWLSSTTGRYDVIALARFSSNDALSRFIHEDMPKIQGVLNSESFLCLHREKDTFSPLPL